MLELTIAIALFTTLMGSLFGVLHPVQGTFAAASDVVDIQQRLRIAADTLTRDLMAAGAGSYVGTKTGPLVHYFAPVQSIRTGTTSDVMSILYVRSTAVQTTLLAALPADGEILRVEDDPGCAVGADVCGITVGMTLLIYDEIGNFDAFAVVDVAPDHARVRATSRPVGALRPAYQAGSKVVEAESRTYARKTIVSPPGNQLVRNDVPVLEHVTGLTFEYFGDPEPPRLTPDGPTYGPKPPPLTSQTTGYPIGENCTFQVDASGSAYVPRLPALNATGALVKLTPAQLADGPWCPDEADANRWDADLLRVRKIGITVRVEAALAPLRGRVPDQEIYWEIAPRNLALR